MKALFKKNTPLKKIILSAAALAGCFFIAILHAQETHIYELRHQLADNLAPTIEGTLLAGETVQSFNNQLIVTASPASQNQVAQLLQTLDMPIRNLLVMVRNNRVQQGSESGTQVSGGIRTGEVYLGAGRPVYHDSGLVIQHDGLRVHTEQKRGQQNTQQEQKLRVMEGEPAWISSGQTIAYRNHDAWGNPVTDFHDVDQGFYVTARLTGNHVQLSISTTNDKLSDDPRRRKQGIIQTEHLSTSVRGNIGEWIDLGGITLQDNTGERSTTGVSHNTGSSIGDIAIRVVPID